MYVYMCMLYIYNILYTKIITDEYLRTDKLAYHDATTTLDTLSMITVILILKINQGYCKS